MKKILKKTWGTVITILCFIVVILFAAAGCDKSDTPPVKTGNNVSFTPCKQNELKSSDLSDKADVEFTDKGVQITHYNFEVTCDFTTVNVNHTFINGVLNITQQGSPNRADCTCYTDVSYTIEGISHNEVNVIFINGVQVYCYNENYPKEIPFTEYSLAGTSCQWRNFESDKVIVINSDEELQNYIVCADDNYSKIDFSRYSLMCAMGTSPSSPPEVSITQLLQTSDNEYALHFTVRPGVLGTPGPWFISIKIPKLSQNAIVTLNKVFKL